MTDTLMNKGGEDPLEEARAFVAKWMTHFGTIQQVLEENAQLKERVAALEAENAVLTDTLEQWKSNDEWSNRVTYDPRRMDSVRVSKNDQGMFSQCREIVLKLVDEFGKNDLSQE